MKTMAPKLWLVCIQNQDKVHGALANQQKMAVYDF
jgi:hypothetical protein